MARPRTLSDDELLDRIDAALSTRADGGPWSLHDVAPAVGLSPAGLLKRFGSKDGLLHALARRWIARIPVAPLGDLPAERELRAYVAEAFGAPSDAAAVYALGEVLGDLRSPTLTAALHEGWSAQVRYLEQLLEQLPLPRLRDPHGGAMLLLDALHGALFRHAAGLEPTPATDTLDRFLETWT
ncbi:TetR/AcrR family transcriptional regulator [Microcella sp.]|uniref:TetR/AcrR family transcriptional regulator n=1 Tax=Microcella sp. TaxID=1913979 RepID=UPI003F6FBCD9